MKDQIINKILNKDGSLKWQFSKTKYVQKYLNAQEITFLNNSFGHTLSEKYWCLINNIMNPPKCICGNDLRFKSFKEGGYQKYCSKRCCSINRSLKDKELTLQRRKKTNIERYGTECPLNRKKAIEKRHSTNIKKYGGISPYSSPNVYEKALQTRKDRGTYQNMKSKVLNGNKEIQKRIKQTNIKKYGVENPNQRPEIIDKRKTTCLRKYGSTTYLNSPEGFKNRSHRYHYNSESFDSSWELAFWIYHKDNNIPIIRNYDLSFDYTNNKGKTSRYYPDFIVNNNKIIEIKSKYIYDPSNFALKLDVCKKNNIQLIMEDDIKFYIDYVRSKYSVDYMKQFKRKSVFDYKKKNIIEIQGLDDLFKLRNKSHSKIMYTCKKCNNKIITSYKSVICLTDLICKKCRN